jgi:hypothetical protein
MKSLPCGLHSLCEQGKVRYGLSNYGERMNSFFNIHNYAIEELRKESLDLNAENAVLPVMNYICHYAFFHDFHFHLNRWIFIIYNRLNQ